MSPSKLTYSAAVALYLGAVGFSGGLTGVLLWPVVVLHVFLTVLLTIAFLTQTKSKSDRAT